MDKEENWRSREQSSGSFRKMHQKYCLELFFVVTYLLSIWTEYFLCVLVCFACLRACMLTCLACLDAWRACVLMCLRAYVLSCLAYLLAYVLGVLACLRAYVLPCLVYLCAFWLVMMKCSIFSRVCVLGVLFCLIYYIFQYLNLKILTAKNLCAFLSWTYFLFLFWYQLIKLFETNLREEGKSIHISYSCSCFKVISIFYNLHTHILH